MLLSGTLEKVIYKYGRQFVVKNCNINTDPVFLYLSSGLVRHVGETTARQIVEQFEDPLEVITNWQENYSFCRIL